MHSWRSHERIFGRIGYKDDIQLTRCRVEKRTVDMDVEIDCVCPVLRYHAAVCDNGHAERRTRRVLDMYTCALVRPVVTLDEVAARTERVHECVTDRRNRYNRNIVKRAARTECVKCQRALEDMGRRGNVLDRPRCSDNGRITYL